MAVKNIEKSLEKAIKDAYSDGYADGRRDALTRESAIEFLQEDGWMPEHDRILTEVAKVRCGECKYAYRQDEYTLFCNGRGWPMVLVTADDFCSRGARKEVEGG